MTAGVIGLDAVLDSTVNHILTNRPAPGAVLRCVRLGENRVLPLTELYDRAVALAGRLVERGVAPGDRIGVLAANQLDWVLLDLAALHAGAVVAGMDPAGFEPDEDLCARYGLHALYTDRPQAGAGVRQLSQVWAQSGPGGPLPPSRPRGPAEPLALKFTSGSTGVPKSMTASVGSADSSLAAVQEIFDHGPGDDVFVFLPLSLLQQRYWIYSALRHGHDIVLSTPDAAFDAMGRTEPTVVMGVPGFYEAAQKRIEMTAARTGDLKAAARAAFGPRVRYLWTGSAPARPSMIEFYFDVGLPLYEGYGLNETCIVSKNHPGANRVGSVGRVLPGKRIRFDDDGVLRVAADFPVADRYEHAGPGESDAVFVDGEIRTNDTGYVDDDGFLHITGRADDAIVLDNGRKVLVRGIEEAFREHPAVAECVVYHVKSRLVAVVSPTSPPADLDDRDLADAFADTNTRLRPDERVARVIVADEAFTQLNGLLTAQAKPRRARIRDRFRARIDDPREGIHVRVD